VATAVLTACLGSAVALATPTAPAAPTSTRQADAAWFSEGLEQIQVEGLDRVYVRPGASLGAYNSVLLQPISVAFRRTTGRPTAGGTRNRMRDQDIQRIKEGLSTLVEEQVRTELTAGGYTFSDEPGDDVLNVHLAIVNLNITAPELTTTSRVRTYATTAGEMTLVAELRDSVTGELLARIMDRGAARDFAQMRMITRSDNVAEARTIANAWARALRNGLDKSRASDP
jgi:hypothetical protein